MAGYITISLTLAEARALRCLAQVGLDEALDVEPDGRVVRTLPPATWAAAERAIARLDEMIAVAR
jgi:hypothetical protein